jgi:ribosomal-protein-alanine N-acetyltransferase
MAAAAGAEEMILEVAATNAAARALYAGLGYLPAGRRPRYYTRPAAPPVDALVLRHPLVAPSQDP